MSRFLYTVLFMILCTNAIAQPTPIWGFGIGGPGNDFSRACRVSANGNVLVTGAFYGTIDLDPSSAVYNITSNGGEDIFLACYSSTGAFLWGFNIGGVNNDGGYNVTTDIFNNVYISGFFQGGADFDPGGGVTILPYAGGLGSTTEGDGFVAKYSSTGTFLWAKDLGGPTIYDYDEALGTDVLGNLYVGGVYNTTMTISSTITFSTATTGTAYLIKYDPAGNVVWGHSFGETGAGGFIDCIPRSLQVSNGFIYMCGFFSGTSDFQPWATSTILTAVGGGTNDDAFLAKYDTAGNLVFVKQVGGAGTDDELEALVLDSVDNIYLTGFTLSPSVTYDFSSPGTSTVTSPGGGGNYDIMMAKYSSTGVYQWGTVLGSTGDDLGRAIDIAGGKLFCSGTFMNTVDFDPSVAVANLVSAGGTDMFLTKYDLNGNYLCGFRVGGAGNDAGYGLSHNSSGDIVSSGQFAGATIDFDPTGGVFPLTSLGGTDAYLMEYNPICSSSSSSCFTNSLIINTGYNPVTASAVPGGANGATPVPDPKWKLTAVSPGVATAIAATALTGLIEVTPGNSADVIINPGGWINNPAADPGGWISCLNSNYYYTDGTGTTAYNMTLGRPFKTCSDDSIKLDCYIANDNYISATNMDGVPLAFSQPASTTTTNFTTYTHFTQTVYLLAGTHIFNVDVNNYNISTPSNNPTGLNIYGTVSSATGSNSIVAEIDSTCTCTAVVICPNSLAMPDSLHLCLGDTTTIHDTLTGPDTVSSYSWSPATGLSSTTILSPLLTATTSGWYTLTVNSLSTDNLVVNGDFSAGNTGFTSSYTYVSGPGSLFPAAVYAIDTDPYPDHPAAISFGDHTTGTGYMMSINGASTPISVWCETIPVTPNTNYNFSAWVANWSAADVGAAVPVLQFMINGVLIGAPDAITAAPGIWTNFFATWNSGISTTANICIYDETTAVSGNDFALDDISFTQICTLKDSVYVQVKIPDTTHMHTDTTVCAGTLITLTAPAGYISYLWNTGSTATTITAGAPPGTYWVYDSSSCAIMIDTFNISVKFPDTTYAHTDTSVCANIPSVTLSAGSGYISYLWNTGSTGSSITVSATGSYWVYDSSSCAILIDTFNVTFKPLPIVNLGNDTSFCVGDSLTLSSIQPAGNTYLWNTGSAIDTIHVSASGTYWLTVTENGCTATDSIHILVSPIPLVNLGPDTSECSGLPIVLQSSYTYTGATYLWSNGTGGVTTTATATGTYWLQVTVGGCPGADTINVTILYDTFTLHNHDTAICKGASVQILGTGTPGQTYQWQPTAGIPVSNISSPLITPDTSATYVVTVYYATCPDLFDTVHIDVQPVPIVYIGGSRSVCKYDTIHITASVSPQWYTDYIYSWSPVVSLDNSTTSTVVFTAGDSTNLILTVTTPAGCKGVDSAEVYVHTDNFVHFDTTLYICPGDSVQLKPVSTGGGVTTYLWQPALYLNDPASTAPWVYPITSQSYWAVATSQFGCRDTLAANIIVEPSAVLYVGDSVTIYPGESYQISPQTNCVTFIWFPPGGLNDAYISNPLATPEISTKYVVIGTTEWGCKIKDSISIYVDPETLLALPNAFTPGNGPNNILKLLKRGIATLNYFRIYNRWGNLVYESSDIDAGWDGTYNGKPQPFDVFVYEVEAVTSTGKVFHKAGNVTLIR